MAEARRPVQNSGAPLLPPEISRGALANVSRRPFSRARQGFLPVLAAYKSGRSAPPWTPKTLFPSPPPKPSRLPLAMAPTDNIKWAMLRELALARFPEDAKVAD
jgi:hypothetical protein